MKVLLDTCVWGPAAELLIAAGHDAVWSGEWSPDPGDDAILAHAFAEERVVITLDKDFGELAVLHQRPHCGIIRLVDVRAQEQGPTVLAVLERFGPELERGSIVTVEPGRLRVRAPE